MLVLKYINHPFYLSFFHDFSLKLLDEILTLADPEVLHALAATSGSSTGLALQYILSFSGATPPLSELLKLWDFFLAFGIHMNVICVAAQIMLAREQILTSDRPAQFLK